MHIVRQHKKMPSVNKPVLMRIKIASEEDGLVAASAEVAAALVAVIWADLDVNLLKAY
jgi:hypothetical protein